MGNPLNPVTVLSSDAAGNPVPVTPATPMPVTDVGEAAGTTPATDPNSLSSLSNQALLRGIMITLQNLTTAVTDLKTQAAVNDTALMQMIVEAYELGGAPQDYKDSVAVDIQTGPSSSL